MTPSTLRITCVLVCIAGVALIAFSALRLSFDIHDEVYAATSIAQIVAAVAITICFVTSLFLPSLSPHPEVVQKWAASILITVFVFAAAPSLVRSIFVSRQQTARATFRTNRESQFLTDLHAKTADIYSRATDHRPFTADESLEFLAWLPTADLSTIGAPSHLNEAIVLLQHALATGVLDPNLRTTATAPANSDATAPGRSDATAPAHSDATAPGRAGGDPLFLAYYQPRADLAARAHTPLDPIELTIARLLIAKADLSLTDHNGHVIKTYFVAP